jgi:hypothetical protein
MPRIHSKLSVARLTCAERATQALELRKAGLTFREIGERMGVTEDRAHQIVTRELARLNARRAEDAGAVTRLEVERLDVLLAAVWEKAAGGDPAAIDRVLAIMARRARLLGIDLADQRVTVPPPGNQLVLNVSEMVVERKAVAGGEAAADVEVRALEHHPGNDGNNGAAAAATGPTEAQE